MTIEGGGRIAHVFDESLRHPSPPFALGEQLAKLYPERYLLESDGKLDVQAFARAGHCTVETRSDIYNQFDTYWSEEHGVYRWPATVWLTITWESATFDLVVIKWEGSMMRAQH